VRFFWDESTHALNLTLILSPCARGEAERIAVVLTLGGIRGLIVLSIVSHSALKNE